MPDHNDYMVSIKLGLDSMKMDRVAPEVKKEILDSLRELDELVHGWADGDPYDMEW